MTIGDGAFLRGIKIDGGDISRAATAVSYAEDANKSAVTGG